MRPEIAANASNASARVASVHVTQAQMDRLTGKVAIQATVHRKRT